MPLFGRPWLCSSNKSTCSTSTAGSRSSKSSKRSLKQRKRHQQALKQFLKEELQAAPRQLEDHSETFHMDQSDSTRHGEEDRQVRFHPSVDKEMERRRKYRLKNPPKIDPRRVQTRTRQQLDIAVVPTTSATTASTSTEVPSSQRDQLLLQHQDSFSLLEKAPAWGWGYVEEDENDDDTACTAESSYASFFDDCLVFGSNNATQQAVEDTFVYLSPNMAEF